MLLLFFFLIFSVEIKLVEHARFYSTVDTFIIAKIINKNKQKKHTHTIIKKTYVKLYFEAANILRKFFCFVYGLQKFKYICFSFFFFF